MIPERKRATIFGVDGIYINAAAKIAQVSIARRMPSLIATQENVEAGGLMSYGQSFADSYYRAAAYVDRIFKGAKPATCRFNRRQDLNW